MAKQDTHRALIALDAAGAPRVLATDSAMIAFEFDDMTTDAENIGILSAKDIGPGLWLWEGKAVARDVRGHEDLYPEWEMDFEGTLTDVTIRPDIQHLLRLKPPEPEYPEDDRESPGV